MIDLRKLRDAQLPDFLGNLIPAGATDGSVTWVRLDNVAVMGRLMVINRGAGMASSYDCCVCPCPMNHTPALDYLSPASSSMAVGGSVGLIYYAGYTDCNYFTYEYNETSRAAWSSAQPSIATVNSTGVVTGQSGGTTSVTGEYSAYTYYYNPYESPTCSTGVLETGYPSSSISVGGGTPVISSINPDYWPVGATTGSISGRYFGTSPSVSLSDPTISFSYTPVNDGQINFAATVPQSDVNGTVTITVTSNGYNGSGFIAMPNGGSQPNSKPASASLPNLTCGGATRGSSATCTVSNYGSASGFSWSFRDGQTGATTVTSSGGSSWSGVVVQSGTVLVTWTGLANSLPASLTVNARTGWAFTAVSPVKEANGAGTGACAGGLPTLGSPPTATSGNIGESCLALEWSYKDSSVSGGPNKGYWYVTSSSSSTPSGVATAYQWERVPDLDNTSSAFYQKQTGTYNAQSDPSGCISGGNLATQTQRHEIGLASSNYIESHWGNYQTALNASGNNFGTIMEGAVGQPSGGQSGFEKSLNANLNNALNAIDTAFAVEPYDLIYNEYDVLLGYINYAPNYTSCK